MADIYTGFRLTRTQTEKQEKKQRRKRCKDSRKERRKDKELMGEGLKEIRK